MQDPLESAELLAFCKTVDAKSLSRAAAELGVPRATISRRLARLEQRLGARLLRRTTRSLTLTHAGDALYRHARLALEAVARAEASVRPSDQVIRGDLRVSVLPIATPKFYQMLCEFSRKYPELRVHVHVSTQHVDLNRDGYDAAIRASSELEPGLVARTLTRAKMIAVASPAYLAKSGKLRGIRDLRQHRCLLGFARGELPQTHWPLAGQGKVPVDGVFVSNEPPLVCAAALAGLGIALLPTVLVDDLVESGALIHVLPGLVEADSRIAVVYAERELMPPQVRAFVEAVAAWASAEFGKSAAAPGPRKPVRRRAKRKKPS
jgi:DNA-binding transcriptional LysR family regulator